MIFLESLNTNGWIIWNRKLVLNKTLVLPYIRAKQRRINFDFKDGKQMDILLFIYF